MIDQIMERCFEVLYFVLLAGWRALTLFAIVAILTLVMRDRVPARYICWLWLIVIVRLLLPVSATSWAAISSVADAPVLALLSAEDDVPAEPDGFGTFNLMDEHGTSMEDTNITADEAALPASSVAQQPFNQVEAEDTLFEQVEPLLVILLYSVIIGLPVVAIVLLLRNIVSHVSFAMKLWSLPLVNDRATVDCLLRVCDELGVGRRPKLKLVPSLHAPAMFGMFRPVVCLPEGWREELTTEQLEWVFRHEVAHIKGRDGLLISIATLAKSVHWFNPLSWIAVTKLQQNMERAADELATLHLDATQIREYGELLLRFAAGQPSAVRRPTVGLIAMAAPKDLQRRIKSLGSNIRKKRWVGGLTAVPVIGMFAVCGLTDAKPIERPVAALRQIPNFEVALAGGDWKRPNRLNQSPFAKDLRVVSINVEKALQKAKELQPGIDAEKFVMSYFASYTTSADQHTEAKILDGVMTVNVTKQQEVWMKQMLSAFEQSGLWQIVTELKVIDTNVRLLDQFDWSTSESTARIGRFDRSPVLDDPEHWEVASFSINALDWSPASNEDFTIEQSVSVPVRAAKISRQQSERFIQQVQSDNRSNVIQAPKVTMFNGQRGVISDVVQRPFVTDVLEISGDNSAALQPKISVFEDGWKFSLMTTASADEDVNLQMVFTHSSVDGVKLASLPNGRGNDPEERVTIQVPTVKSDSIAVESVLKESEVLLVFSPKPYSDGSERDNAKRDYGMGQVFMIRTELIADSDFLKSFVPGGIEQ